MPEYDPRDLAPFTPVTRPDVATARATIPPAGTLAHLAALQAEGAGAFTRLAEANGILDPIPFFGSYPRRSARFLSLTDGASVMLPGEGL